MEKPEGWKAKGREIFVLFPLIGLKTPICGAELLSFWKICEALTIFFFLFDTSEFCTLTEKGRRRCFFVHCWIEWKIE